MVVDEARQQVAQLQEEVLARGIASGYMWKGVERRSWRSRSRRTSASWSVVAEGMATALRPEESMAQQSEHPSVIQSGSPGRRRSSTGWL